MFRTKLVRCLESGKLLLSVNSTSVDGNVSILLENSLTGTEKDLNDKLIIQYTDSIVISLFCLSNSILCYIEVNQKIVCSITFYDLRNVNMIVNAWLTHILKFESSYTY